MTVPTILLSEYHKRLEAQGVPGQHMACVCPRCGTVQSFADLLDAFAASDPAVISARFRRSATDPRLTFGTSCVGRYSEKPARGCDWTLGGFLQLHRLLVTGGDAGAGSEPAFEPATPEQAVERMNQRLEAAKSTPTT